MMKYALRLAVFSLVVVASPEASALKPRAGGFFETGTGTLRDAQGIKYIVTHEIRALPAQKSVEAVIAADTDKQLTVFAYRALPCSELKAMVRGGMDRAGIGASAGPLAEACNQEAVPARARVFVRYQAATQTTTLSVEGGRSTTVRGLPAMRAVWRAFFSETPSFSRALVARL